MILYSYLCDICGPFEEYGDVGESSNPSICPTCDRPAPRTIGPTTTRWNALGTDPNFPSAYNKWAVDRDKRYKKELKQEYRD